MAHTLETFAAACRRILSADAGPAGREQVCVLLRDLLTDEAFVAVHALAKLRAQPDRFAREIFRETADLYRRLHIADRRPDIRFLALPLDLEGLGEGGEAQGGVLGPQLAQRLQQEAVGEIAVGLAARQGGGHQHAGG